MKMPFRRTLSSILILTFATPAFPQDNGSDPAVPRGDAVPTTYISNPDPNFQPYQPSGSGLTVEQWKDVLANTANVESLLFQLASSGVMAKAWEEFYRACGLEQAGLRFVSDLTLDEAAALENLSNKLNPGKASAAVQSALEFGVGLYHIAHAEAGKRSEEAAVMFARVGSAVAVGEVCAELGLPAGPEGAIAGFAIGVILGLIVPNAAEEVVRWASQQDIAGQILDFVWFDRQVSTNVYDWWYKMRYGSNPTLKGPERIEGMQWFGPRSKRERRYNEIWDESQKYMQPPADSCQCGGGCGCGADRKKEWAEARKNLRKAQEDAYMSLEVLRAEASVTRWQVADRLLSYVPGPFGTAYGMTRALDDLAQLAKEAPAVYREITAMAQEGDFKDWIDSTFRFGEDAQAIRDGVDSIREVIDEFHLEKYRSQLEAIEKEMDLNKASRETLEACMEQRKALVKELEEEMTRLRMGASTAPGWTGSNAQVKRLEDAIGRMRTRVEQGNAKLGNFWARRAALAEQRAVLQGRLRDAAEKAGMDAGKVLGAVLGGAFFFKEMTDESEGSVTDLTIQQTLRGVNYDTEEGAEMEYAFVQLKQAYSARCQCREEEPEDEPDEPEKPSQQETTEEDEERRFEEEHPYWNAFFEMLPELIEIIVDNWPDFNPKPRPGPDTEYDPDIHTDTQTQQQEQQQGYEYWPGDSTNGTYGVYTNATYETTDVSTNGTYEATDVSTNGTTSVSTNAAGPVQGDEPSKPQEEKGPEGEESPIEQALALMIDAGLGEGETVLEMEQVLHDLIEGNYEGEGEPSVEEILKMAEEGGLFGDWTGGEEGTDGGCFDGPEGPSIGGCFGGDAQGGGDVWGTIKTTTVQKLESWATKQLDSWIAKNPELQKWFGILGIDGKWIVGGVKEIWGILTGNGSLSDKIGNLAEWAQNKLCDMAVSALNYGLDKLQQWLSGIAQKWIGKAVNWLKNLLGEHGIKIPDKLLGKFQAALEKLVGKGIGKVVDIGRDAGERIINRMRPSQGGGSNGTQILQMGGGGGGTGNRKP